MSIITNLDDLMKKRNLTLTELANRIGITPANLSNIKNGYSLAIRFSTLERLCKELQCQPGDLLEYRENQKKKVIPLLLDYSGTTDHLLKGGAENVKEFFDAIKELQIKTEAQVQCAIISGSSHEGTKSKFLCLNDLAINYGLPDLFIGGVAEYCGSLVGKEDRVLCTIDPRILGKKAEIKALAESYGARINPDVSSYFNVVFNDTITVDGVERPLERADIARFEEAIRELMNDDEIETSSYFDDIGKECDIKPKIHNKAKSVEMLVDLLAAKYDIPFVIIGGDSQEEDLKMYTWNIEKFKQKGLHAVFIAPSNIGTLSKSDNNIIVGDWENARGIVHCIHQISSRVKVMEDGGVRYE